MEKQRPAWLRVIERFLLTLGLVLLGFYVLARIHGVVTLHAALRSFEEERQGPGVRETAARLPSGDSLHTDYSLWSEQRIKAYKSTLGDPTEKLLAVLKNPKLRLEAPVLDGMDDLTLNAGVGRITGTARPGQPGNIGIAGHRDGFFRPLKDIAKGDRIELVTRRGTDVYAVDKVFITGPDDVSVLRPAKPGLTLVTCYPFYFVGSAPQRYIVQASLTRGSGPSRVQ